MRLSSGKSGFSLQQMLITLVVLAVVSALAFPTYSKFVAKSKEAEALLNLEAIRKAEFLKRAATGSYADAADTAEINKIFGLGIQDNFFGYKIVDASDSTFLAIAERLGTLAAGVPPLIAVGPEGVISYPAAGGGGGGGGAGGVGGGEGGGGSGGGSSGGGAGGSGGGGAGGGGETGGGGSLGGISFTPATLNFIPRGADEWTAWPDVNSLNITGDPDDVAKLTAMFDLIADSVVSALADDLVRRGLEITVGDPAFFDANTIAVFQFCFEGLDCPDSFTDDFPGTPDPLPRMLFNPLFMGETAEQLSVTLAHEATHFGQFLDGSVLDLMEGELSIIDVEFRAFWNQSYYWEQIREDFAPFDTVLEQSNEGWYQAALGGEASLRAAIAEVYL